MEIVSNQSRAFRSLGSGKMKPCECSEEHISDIRFKGKERLNLQNSHLVPKAVEEFVKSNQKEAWEKRM
jgi:hypothetical protein